MAKKIKESDYYGTPAVRALIEELLNQVSEDTPVVYVDTVSDLPKVGSVRKIYVEREGNTVYRFDEDTTSYKKVGIGYNDGDEVVFDANGVKDASDGTLIDLTRTKPK